MQSVQQTTGSVVASQASAQGTTAGVGVTTGAGGQTSGAGAQVGTLANTGGAAAKALGLSPAEAGAGFAGLLALLGALYVKRREILSRIMR
jgi:hypothetical protein